jgi:glycine amidinotransferase
VYGKRVFVGNSGNASSTLGIRFLQKFLAPQGYILHEVKLASYVMHLDCVAGMVKNGLMILHEEALLEGIPSELSSYDKIQISKREAQFLAANGFSVNQSTYIMDLAFMNIGNAIAEHGITVKYIDFQVTRLFGGSFRRSTQPLSLLDNPST